MKRIFIAMLALATVALSACSDDDTTKITTSGHFDFSGNEISLKGANLYLAAEASTGAGHTYRNYFITDGIFVVGRLGWELSDYHKATYVLAVQLAVPQTDNIFTAGSYPQYSSSNDVPDDSNLGWVSFRNTDVHYRTLDGTLGGAPVLVSGGLEDGETMEIEFTGTLDLNDNGGEEGKFYFKGKVQDLSHL